MRFTIAPGEANRVEKLGLTDVDTYQSKVGEVGNGSLHAALKDLSHCGFISTLEGFESVGNRCEVLQFPSDQYAVLRGVNPGPEPITGSTSNGDAGQCNRCNENPPSERVRHSSPSLRSNYPDPSKE
jgi:hypothetical protein